MIKRKISAFIIAFAAMTCIGIPTEKANATTTNVSVGVVTASSGLNLRASASTGSSVIRTIPYNAKVNIKSTSSGWYYVEYSGSYGYVSSSYISISSGSTSSTTEQVGTITASSGLNLRTSASTSASVLTTIPYNAKVNIKSTISGWYYVEYNGKYGYVSSSYVSVSSGSNPSGDSSTGNGSSDSGKIGIITASSGLNLRTSASTSASVIRTIPYNAKVNIKNSLSGWYYVEYSGSYGYVSSSYVSLSNTSSGSTTVSKYDQVLSVLKAQIGSPYVYGGSGQFITDSLINSLRASYPSANYDLIGRQYYNAGYRAFDCSGFMQYGFAQVGISIGRTTYGQLDNGTAVAVSSAKPGDLLFNINKNHVGMYIGNNQWIESPSSGKYVRIASVPWSSIGYARRIL